jgi:tRNA(adenine34) deaminase
MPGGGPPPFLFRGKMDRDEKFMAAALRQAEKALARGDIPVGCVIVQDGKIIARGHNLRELKNDPTAHAEIVALRKAGRKLGSWRLNQAEVFVTCEPCAMCAGALVLARVRRVVYGCRDPKAGAVDTFFGIGRSPKLNHRFEVKSGVMEEQCQEQLSRFFKKLRAKL